MKKAIALLLFLIAAPPLFSQYKTELRGTYVGKNLYVQNPVKSTGAGFCVDSISVNGVVSKEKLQESAFEINFASFQLKYGDSLQVVLYHSGDCSPKVLNPGVGPGLTPVLFEKAWIDSLGVLHFISEGNGIPYLVQQFRWNKWVTIGEVAAVAAKQEYLYDVKPYLCSGENAFRVSLPYFDCSSTVNYTSDRPGIIFDATSWCSVIAFSRETMYELYDKNGNMVLKGFGTQIDCSGLQQKHTYYLNYDNKSEKVKLKKCTPEEKKNAPEMKNGVAIYPNPANTDITVSTDTSYAGVILGVELAGADGKRVRYTEMQGGSTVQVSVADLPAGMYIVRIFRENERMSNQKITVRH